jgi:hypothetical protein
MALAEKHELVEALALAGTDEALGIGVQIGTASRQADRDDAGGGEEGPELGRVERVTLEEQDALALEEPSTMSRRFLATCNIQAP